MEYSRPEDREEGHSGWNLPNLFDCFSARKHMRGAEQCAPRAGISRDVDVTYLQPHLVQPMKLTVWDDMPPTPPPSISARFLNQSRSIASRASERASFSVRRRTSARPSISSPMPNANAIEVRQARRRSFRPLELSIYLPNNRLSDLPEFDAVSFSDGGEIKLPPRALLRARSAEMVPRELPDTIVPLKPASMFERRSSRLRRDTVVSSVAESRPSSSYEALHSHPVSWYTLPGGEPHIDMTLRPQNSVTVLSPMQEEFTPPCTAGLINDLVSDFPKIEASREKANSTFFNPPAPSPKVHKADQLGPFELSASPISSPQLKTVPCYCPTTNQKRVSQWLGNRSHSGSISTIASHTTSSSFAEHRRKRSQFYMLSASQSSPPQPLRSSKPSHRRTVTASTTASTAASVLSYSDVESMTTAPTVTDIQSRSGTIRSTSTTAGLAPMALPPIVSGVPDLPPNYGQVMGLSEKDVYPSHVVIKEINGPLRSPIGVAF